MSDLAGNIDKALDGLESLLFSVRATGGYKYRAVFKGTDKEVDEYIAKAVPKLRAMIISLVLAEEMLQEPCPNKVRLKQTGKPCGHVRWAEYVERRKTLFAETDKRQIEKQAEKIRLAMEAQGKAAVKP